MVKGKSKNKKGLSSALHYEELPAFDQNALSALTDKIEKGLHRKTDLPANENTAVASHDKPLKTYTDTRPKKGQVKPSPTQELPVGKKRDAQGNIKREKQITVQNLQSTGVSERDVLLQEILTLGGTEEDLELVEDIDSDDQESDLSLGTVKDSKFAAELSSFVNGLGFMQQDHSEPDAEESKAYEWEDESDHVDRLPTAVTTTDAVAPARQEPEKGIKYLDRLIFQARADWHAAELPELPLPVELGPSKVFHEAITELKKYALSLLETDSNTYASKHLSATSSHRFLNTIMSSGTLSDKVSALTLVVQESPVHTTKSFESLINLAKKRSRGQAVSALGALKDLLGTGVVLPSNRRLYYFDHQPGLLGTLQEEAVRNWTLGTALPGKITQAHLISWAYEDWLKDSYFGMLKVLEVWCNDEIEFARQRAVTYVYELLREKPEQESNLLRLLVNKLGDPEKKIASRASYLILQLQTTHPLMKLIIICAIENELLLRPNQSSHARYYAINTLNQTILSVKEEEVARKLLSIYFDLFVTLLTKPDGPQAAPGPVINKKGQIQGGGGPLGKMALEKATKAELAKQISQETTEKMISAVLTGVNRAFPFAKSDDSTLDKHMNLLFKITHSANFNTSIQALMLIQHLATSKNIATERFYRTLYESLLDPRLITSSKHTLYLNLLYRALKADLNVKRVKAFGKRLVQIITLHQPPFICGVLYLLRELEKTFPSFGSLLNEPEEQDDADEEVFRDVPDDPERDPATGDSGPAPTYSHKFADPETKRSQYDGRKRDPEHSNADRSCLWELIPFIAHFHPSVSMFARRLLEDTEMPAKPDLASHTLIHFLDRFVYRNAKAATGNLRGSSIMQPLAGGDSQGIFVSSGLVPQSHPVNSEAFWRKKVEDVAVDEVFFHKYFSQIGHSKKGSTKKATQVHGAASSADEEDEHEDEIWQALVESRPEVEGDKSDDSSDLEMLDLDDSDSGSSADSEDLPASDEGSEDQSLISADDSVIGSEEGRDEESDLGEDDLFDRELQSAKSVQVKDKAKETSRSRKKRMKSLPTFASAEDYAAILEQDDDENL